MEEANAVLWFLAFVLGTFVIAVFIIPYFKEKFWLYRTARKIKRMAKKYKHDPELHARLVKLSQLLKEAGDSVSLHPEDDEDFNPWEEEE